jgi:four helix bundle protein
MRDFRKLIAWQKAAAFEDRIEPFIERIATRRATLADQIDRAAGSVPASIAEGCGRETTADFKRFLTQSISSTTVLENHLSKARRRGLITQEEHDSLVEDVIEVRKVIHGLRRNAA